MICQAEYINSSNFRFVCHANTGQYVTTLCLMPISDTAYPRRLIITLQSATKILSRKITIVHAKVIRFYKVFSLQRAICRHIAAQHLSSDADRYQTTKHTALPVLGVGCCLIHSALRIIWDVLQQYVPILYWRFIYDHVIVLSINIILPLRIPLQYIGHGLICGKGPFLTLYGVYKAMTLYIPFFSDSPLMFLCFFPKHAMTFFRIKTIILCGMMSLF